MRTITVREVHSADMEGVSVQKTILQLLIYPSVPEMEVCIFNF